MSDMIYICKFGRISGTIRSDNISSYNSLVCAIRNRFAIREAEKVHIRYTMAVAENSLLDNDDDYRVMMVLLENERRSFVHIDVTVTQTALVCVTRDCENLLESSTTMPLGECCTSRSHKSIREPLLSANWKYGLAEIGQVFRNAEEFRVVLVKYCAEEGFKFIYKKNCPKVVTAICSHHTEGCNWKIRGSYREGNKSFEVSKFVKEHTCIATRAPTADRLTQKIVSDLVVDKIKDVHKTWKAKDVLSYMNHSYGHEVSYIKGWRALRNAKEIAFGKEDDTYTKLQWYVRAAKALNPGSYIKLEIEKPSNVFERLFVAWGSSVQGYKFVRPLISLDATFLKGKYEGTLLAATAKTANQELYPIAYAVVNIENGENWRWFLEHLHNIVDHESRPITFLSDRNPGLLEGVPLVFQNASHYYCLYHLCDNIRSKYNSAWSKDIKDYIVTLFKNMAYANTYPEFLKWKEVFERVGKEPAKRFLIGLEPSHWCNVFSRGYRYGETSSQASESFNSCIREDRELPVAQLVENIRERLMRWVHERTTKAGKWKGYLSKEMDTRIEDLIQTSRKWQVKQASDDIFEVVSNETFTVDIAKQTCTCQVWSFKGYPCAHAVRVICKRNLPMPDFIDKYWYADMYRKCYAIPIVPVPTSLENMYTRPEDVKVFPPYFVTLPGRPSKKRKRSQGERQNVRKMKCGRCKEVGNHNRRGCKKVFTPSPEAAES